MRQSRPRRARLAFLTAFGILCLVGSCALAQSDPALQKVLSQMDAAAASFRTTQANFVWEQYWKVVNDKDSQKGTVYYRRSGKEIQMMAEIADPPKTVLFADGKVQVYEEHGLGRIGDLGHHLDFFPGTPEVDRALL